jgi:2-(1,2-epoxy-1,2-dihydrophenyl)acetyl-CoA isomerase
MTASPVKVTNEASGVTVVTLERPARLNALSDELVSGLLRDVFLELGSDTSVRAVVLTGAGRASPWRATSASPGRGLSSAAPSWPWH